MKEELESFQTRATELVSRLRAEKKRVEELEAAISDNQVSIERHKKRLQISTEIRAAHRQRAREWRRGNEIINALEKKDRGDDVKALSDEADAYIEDLNVMQDKIEGLRNDSASLKNQLDEAKAENDRRKALLDSALGSTRASLAQLEVRELSHLFQGDFSPHPRDSTFSVSYSESQPQPVKETVGCDFYSN